MNDFLSPTALKLLRAIARGPDGALTMKLKATDAAARDHLALYGYIRLDALAHGNCRMTLTAMGQAALQVAGKTKNSSNQG
jgi:hypothetical protein